MGVREAVVSFDSATGLHDLNLYADSLLSYLQLVEFLQSTELLLTPDEGTFALGDAAVISSESLGSVFRGTIRDLRDTPEGVVVSVGRRTVTLASLIVSGVGAIGFGDIVALGLPRPTYEVWGYWNYSTDRGFYRLYHGLGDYAVEASLLRALLDHLIDDFDDDELDLLIYHSTTPDFTPDLTSPDDIEAGVLGGSSFGQENVAAGTYYVKAQYVYAWNDPEEIRGPFGDEWRVLVP